MILIMIMIMKALALDGGRKKGRICLRMVGQSKIVKIKCQNTASLLACKILIDLVNETLHTEDKHVSSCSELPVL